MGEGVEAIIDAVLETAPRGQQAAALSARGNGLIVLGDLDTALACFDRALRYDVSFASAWVGRAVVLSARSRENEALGCIHRALDVDPRCAPALVHKGHIMRARGLFQEALTCYEAALGSGALEDAQSGRNEMLRVLGRATSSGAPAPRAVSSASGPAAREDAPRSERKETPAPREHLDPRAEKKSVRQKSFRTDPLVAKKSDPAISLRPPMIEGTSSKRVSTRLASAGSGAHRLTQAGEDSAAIDEVRVLCLANRHVEGLRKLEPIAKRCPSSREAWMLRGQILFSLKQYDAAASSVERVAKLDPKDQEALKLMVKVLAATNKDVRALESAERLLALAPRDPEVHRLHADCLVAAMRHVEAVIAYEKVIHYIPDDSSAWLSLGRTLRQLRRVAEARMSLTKALALAEERAATDVAAQARELLAKLPPSG